MVIKKNKKVLHSLWLCGLFFLAYLHSACNNCKSYLTEYPVLQWQGHVDWLHYKDTYNVLDTLVLKISFPQTNFFGRVCSESRDSIFILNAPQQFLAQLQGIALQRWLGTVAPPENYYNTNTIDQSCANFEVLDLQVLNQDTMNKLLVLRLDAPNQQYQMYIKIYFKKAGNYRFRLWDNYLPQPKLSFYGNYDDLPTLIPRNCLIMPCFIKYADLGNTFNDILNKTFVVIEP